MSLAKNISFLANGIELADALTSIKMTADSDEIEATVLAHDYRSFEQGFKGGVIVLTGIFDADAVNADKIHDVFSAAYGSGDPIDILYSLGSAANGAPSIMMTGVEMKYETPVDVGALVFANATFKSQTGINFGLFLLSAQLNAGAHNGTSVDNGASSNTGGLFQAQFLNNTATGVVVKIQHSTNNSTWVDLSGVTVSLAGTSDAASVTVASGVTINRYIRTVATVSGGDTTLVTAGFVRR